MYFAQIYKIYNERVQKYVIVLFLSQNRLDVKSI